MDKYPYSPSHEDVQFVATGFTHISKDVEGWKRAFMYRYPSNADL